MGDYLLSVRHESEITSAHAHAGKAKAVAAKGRHPHKTNGSGTTRSYAVPDGSCANCVDGSHQVGLHITLYTSNPSRRSEDFCKLTDTDRVLRGAPLFLEVAVKFDDLLLVALESKQTMHIEAGLTLNNVPVQFVETLPCEQLHAILKAMSSGGQVQQRVAVQLHESGEFHVMEAWLREHMLVRLELSLTDKDKNLCSIRIRELLLFKPVQ